jgi:hypothetical protein
MRVGLFFSYLTVLFLVSAPVALAAESDARFTRNVTPVDPVTLRADGLHITLWGVRPAGDAATDLKALDLMDNMIGSSAVTCRAVGGTSTDVVARCSVRTGEDLGLELLGHGYVVVDRRQDVSSVPAYMEAQRAARHSGDGIWRQVVTDDKAGGVSPGVQILLGASPLAGLLLIAFMVHFRLKRLETLQLEEQEQAQRKETQLLTRERHVLVSTLEGELTENKNRIEAFLTIYGDMLDSLKSKTEKPKYQQSGDIVQKHPSLSKTVFETSVGKFSLLDMKLAAQLSKLYAALPREQEYVNIEPGVPLESAVALVEKVMREAEALVPPISAVIAALEEIVASSKKFETQG